MTASIPHPACALSAKRVAALSGLGYLTVATAEPESGGRELCTYSTPRPGTRTLTVTYTAWDSVATARTHWIEGTAASRDLGLVDVPDVGEHAWLFKRVDGASHTTTQQQLQFVKANVMVQVATDESFLRLPSMFGARMAELGKAVAATVT